MKRFIKYSICIDALLLFVLFMGAYTHENDMARNCEKYGNAKAWFHNIECKVKNDTP